MGKFSLNLFFFSLFCDWWIRLTVWFTILTWCAIYTPYLHNKTNLKYFQRKLRESGDILCILNAVDRYQSIVIQKSYNSLKDKSLIYFMYTIKTAVSELKNGMVCVNFDKEKKRDIYTRQTIGYWSLIHLFTLIVYPR